MKKYMYLLTSIALIFVVIIWKFYLADYLTSFYQIDEWGIYLFPVPIAYCILAFLSGSNSSSFKIIITIFIGVFVSILLATNSTLLLQKTLIAIAGALITWALTNIVNSKK